MIDVFVSHTSQDVELAEALVRLLRAALDLEQSQVRCTSVDGYRLPVGAKFEEQLRTEVHDARLFIALITPHTLTSTYVLFELGARWGADLSMVPLLAGGAERSALQGPLATLNAKSCDSQIELWAVVSDIAKVLRVAPTSAPEYASELAALAAASTAAGAAHPTPTKQAHTRFETALRNYFDSQSWVDPAPGTVMGLARGIVARFGDEGSEVIPSVEAEIARRKRDDPNWVKANELGGALSLVGWLGLTPATTEKNQAFLDMLLPSIEPKPTPKS